METIDKYLIFESDDEFADFCIYPYAVFKKDADGNITGYHCKRTDEYLTAVKEEKIFVIKDKRSEVLHRKRVEKKVPITDPYNPHLHQTTLASFTVNNIMYLGEKMLEKIRSKNQSVK